MLQYLDLKRINSSFEPELTETVIEVIHSGRFINGKFTHTFEKEFAAFCGANYCIGTANGMDALSLILMAYKVLDIFQDDSEIITPAVAPVTSILAVIRAGLKPVLCESSPDTFTMNANRIDDLITDRTVAILPVHIYGFCSGINEIVKTAKRYGLKVIEDAASATGALYQGKRAGNLGDAAGFSFFPENNLGALGDGGAATTNDLKLADCIRTLANCGSTQKYTYLYKGIKSHLDEIQAAVLSVKLKRIDKDNSKRKKLAKMYMEGIDHPFITVPRIKEMNNHVFHKFPVFCQRRDILQAWLLKNEIEAKVYHSIPPHRQPAFIEFKNCFLPVTEQIHREELSLPVSPVMTEDDVNRVIDVINKF